MTYFLLYFLVTIFMSLVLNLKECVNMYRHIGTPVATFLKTPAS